MQDLYHPCSLHMTTQQHSTFISTGMAKEPQAEMSVQTFRHSCSLQMTAREHLTFVSTKTTKCTTNKSVFATPLSPLSASNDGSATFHLRQHKNGKRTASRNECAKLCRSCSLQQHRKRQKEPQTDVQKRVVTLVRFT